MPSSDGHIALEQEVFSAALVPEERSGVPPLPEAAAPVADLALIERCLRGEALACSELYHRYYRQVMPICLRYARSTEEAKDILQESFARVFAKLHSYTGKGSFTGWVKRVTLNTAINHYHATADQRSTVRIGDLGHGDAPMADQQVEHTLARMSADELLALVRALPPGYRMVFNLRVLEGWSHEEIARELGISVGTSKSNLSRARLRLMEQIRDLGIDPGK